MRRSVVLSAIGIIILAVLVITNPFEKTNSEGDSFTDVLYAWGDRQEECSEEITAAAVSEIEGSIIGEHKIDGSNWSIPNIIRHWLGVR